MVYLLDSVNTIYNYFYVYMNTIGERLRNERERIGLNQSDFAEAGGVL